MNRRERLSAAIARLDSVHWNGRANPEYCSKRSKRILELIGDQRVSLIDSRAVTETLLGAGLKLSTVNRYLSVLAVIGVPVSYSKEAGRRDRILSDAELLELDSRVKTLPDSPCKALYALLRDSGCRGLAEWERFDWGRVDWTERVFELDSRKGGIRYRQVPMTDLSSRALSWLYHSKGVKISESSWRAFWSSVRLSDKNVPYDLRHKFCTRMLSKGVPPPTVMLIMGHTNLDQTMEYFHQSSDALRDVAQKLSEI